MCNVFLLSYFYIHTKISYPMKQNYLILYHLGVLNPDKEEYDDDEYDRF